MSAARLLFMALAISLGLMRCAEIVPPDGGVGVRKDTQAPQLVYADPPMYSTFFSQDELRLRFDEYFVLNNAFTQVRISPPMAPKPEFRVKGKDLLDKFKEPLRPNATYIINFGQAIRDYRENNILKNFSYVFSTGAYIDSLEIQGQMVDAWSGEPLEDVLVGLYPEGQDSGVTQAPPYYVAQSRSDGSFVLPYLAPGKYKLVAFDDQNFSLTYDNPLESIGFLEGWVSGDTPFVLAEPIRMFTDDPGIRLLESQSPQPGLVQMVFSQPVQELEALSSRELPGDFMEANPSRDSILYWSASDTLSLAKFALLLNGSRRDSFEQRYSARATRFSIHSRSMTYHTGSILLKLNRPISTFDSGAFLLQTADSPYVILDADWRQTDQSALTLDVDLDGFQQAWLTWSKGAVRSIYGDTLDADTLFIKVSEDPLTGDLIIPNADLVDGNAWLQLESDRGFLARLPYDQWSGGRVEGLMPGKYRASIWLDLDNSGHWTPGSWENRRQPEPIPHRSEELEIRSNWETEWRLN